jgi:hypothetical protein
MKRACILGLVVAGAALAINSPGDNSRAGGEKKAHHAPPYVHTVIFYLKDGAPKNEVESLIHDSHAMLAKIPTVKALWAGRPAEKSTPQFAVKDFQVGLLVLFDNYDGLKTYMEHPLHLEYIKKHGEHWKRVPVYDFENETK